MDSAIEQLKTVPIYKTEKGDIYYDDIVTVLKQCGIEKGDVVITHVDLGAFGKLGDIMRREDFVAIFVEAFKEVLGEEGTIVTPTFSYSFCKGEVYDPYNTPSTIGPFAEGFWKRLDAIRSSNPIFSVAAIGKHAKELTTNLSKNCFGVGSVYDKLHNIPNAKYVVLGVDYFICTQVHYIERLKMVPYRYIKKFQGKIKEGENIYGDEYEFYVRYTDADVETTFDKFEKHLFDNGFLKKIFLGNGCVRAVKIKDIWDEGTKLLEKDPLIFLVKEPNYKKIEEGKQLL